MPVKRFDAAKTRLASVLAPAERAALARRTFETVLRALAGARTLDGWVVVSGAAEAVEQARRLGGHGLDEAEPGLNAAVAQGLAWVEAAGARVALVVAADLPWLRSEDVDEVVATMPPAGPAAVLAPCHRDDGTNLLGLRPPSLLGPAFGPGSFQAHRRLAARHGALVRVHRSRATAFDLDTPDDLDLWRSADGASCEALGGISR